MATVYDDDIKQTEQEIEKLKLELAEKNGILKFLRSKRDALLDPSANLVSVENHIDSEETGVIDLSKLDVPNQYRKTLMDDIWSVVSKLGDQEFMVTSIEAVLKAQHVEIEGKSPRARIASSLSKLLEQGKIVQTFKGSGNIPHRYRLSQNSESVTTGHSDALDL